jgi:hypothetical protein
MNVAIVVPANAGTHNHQRFWHDENMLQRSI